MVDNGAKNVWWKFIDDIFPYVYDILQSLFYCRLYTMTTIYFGTIEGLLSHEDDKGEVAPMSGKDDVPPLAEARELKVRPQKIFTGEGKGWRKRRFVASPVSSWPKREQAALIKAWVEVAELTEEAKAKLAEQVEVARQAAAIVARAAAQAAAKARAAAKKAAKKAARKKSEQPRMWRAHDGSWWQQVGGKAATLAMVAKFEAFRVALAKTTVVAGPAKAVPPSAKSAVAATEVRPSRRSNLKSRKAKARGKIKAQQMAKRQASLDKQKAASVSKNRREAKKKAADLCTGGKRQLRDVTLAERVERKAASMREAIKAKAAVVCRQMLEQAKLRMVARLTQELEESRIKLMKLHRERDAAVARVKDFNDRKTAAMVRACRVAWKIRKVKKLKARAERFKAAALKDAGTKTKLSDERERKAERKRDLDTEADLGQVGVHRHGDYRFNNANKPLTLTLTLTRGYDPLGTLTLTRGYDPLGPQN